jgi:cell division septum initiation protein DivIVA
MENDKKLFRRSLFGYGPEDVYGYLKALNEKLAYELRTKDVRIASLTADNAELKEKLGGADKAGGTFTVPVLEAETLIENARVEAGRILEEATRAGITKRQELQEQVKKEKVKLRILQAEVAGLQKIATSALSKFTTELPTLEEVEETIT